MLTRVRIRSSVDRLGLSSGEGGDTVHPSGFVRRAITIQRYVTEMESLGAGKGTKSANGRRLIDSVTPQTVRGYWSVSAGDICTARTRTNYRQPCLPRVNHASAKSAHEILDGDHWPPPSRIRNDSKDSKNWKGIGVNWKKLARSYRFS